MKLHFLYCYRLHDYDKTFDNVLNDPESSFVMAVPDPQHFRHIDSDSLMPQLNDKDLELFRLLAQQDDLDAAKNMYDDAFLLSARVAHGQGRTYFVLANCASDMKKHVSYIVTLKYEEHNILETQCKCAAGIGPFAKCKHILALLHGIVDFSQRKMLKIHLHCKENLQKCHRPMKFYTGEPVEAKHLVLKSSDQNFRDIANFDPRPPTTESVEKYVENFKNIIINFCATKKCTMPIAQIIKPANKKAIDLDHDYFKPPGDLL